MNLMPGLVSRILPTMREEKMSVRVMADKVMPNHWLEDEGTPRLWRYSQRLGKTTAYSTPDMNMKRWMMDRLVRLGANNLNILGIKGVD